MNKAVYTLLVAMILVILFSLKLTLNVSGFTTFSPTILAVYILGLCQIKPRAQSAARTAETLQVLVVTLLTLAVFSYHGTGLSSGTYPLHTLGYSFLTSEMRIYGFSQFVLVATVIMFPYQAHRSKYAELLRQTE